MHLLSVRRHQIDGEEVIDGQTKLTHEMTEAATERQPTNPGVADDAAGGSEPELLSGAVEFTPEDST